MESSAESEGNFLHIAFIIHIQFYFLITCLFSEGSEKNHKGISITIVNAIVDIEAMF